jgi:hypothetical protein
MHKRLQVLKEEKKRSGNFNRIGAAARLLPFASSDGGKGRIKRIGQNREATNSRKKAQK